MLSWQWIPSPELSMTSLPSRFGESPNQTPDPRDTSRMFVQCVRRPRSACTDRSRCAQCTSPRVAGSCLCQLLPNSPTHDYDAATGHWETMRQDLQAWRTEDMNADDRNLNAIFGVPRQFVVPLFQRPYVWVEEENWEPLWDSLQEVADRHLLKEKARPHFLGAIVLDQMPTPTGEVESRQVIDGQQRLTTLQLLLAAARDLSAELGSDDFAQAFANLTENQVPGSQNPNDKYKVWPTNRDRDPFAKVLSSRSPKEVKAAFGKQANASATWTETAWSAPPTCSSSWPRGGRASRELEVVSRGAGMA